MSWLQSYYGKDFDRLQPVVAIDGKRWAVVRLTRSSPQKGASSVGYVLIQKRGTHASSNYIPLHEGMAGPEELKNMAERLRSQDT